MTKVLLFRFRLAPLWILAALSPAPARACGDLSTIADAPDPRSVALNAAGTLLAVAQQPSQGVTVINLATGASRFFSDGRSGDPVAAVYGPSDYLYVLEGSARQVVVYDPSGNIVLRWNTPAGAQPLYLAVGNNRVYVLTMANWSATILSWTLGGTDEITEGTVTGSFGDPAVPLALTVRADGKVLVAYEELGVGLTSDTYVRSIPNGAANTIRGVYRVTATPSGGLLLAGVSELRVLDSNYETTCSVLESGLVFQDAVMAGDGTIYAASPNPGRTVLRIDSHLPVHPSTWGAIKVRY